MQVCWVSGAVVRWRGVFPNVAISTAARLEDSWRLHPNIEACQSVRVKEATVDQVPTSRAEAHPRTAIQLGARGLSDVEILSGLDDGDEVIISSIDAFNRAELVFISK